jgi:protein-disulfide isomerase
MSKEAKILIVIAVIVIIGGVLLAMFANPQPKQPGATVDASSLVREHSRMTDKINAKVTVVEFGDYRCPACAQAVPELKAVMEEYKDNEEVNFVFRNFPLNNNVNAKISAEAAEAAGAQGKFWEMHELIYQRQSQWSNQPGPESIFTAYASELGLNIDEFNASVSSRKFSNIIETDFDDGVKAGVNSTPTFFVNGIIQKKILSRVELKLLIDEALAK